MTAPAASASAAPHAAQNIILTAIIERPTTATPIAARPAQTVVVADGQTVETLAATYHSDLAATRWANALPSAAEPAAGSTLLLPPGAGALVRVLPGERPSQFAARIGLDPRVLLDYNALTRDTPRAAGSYLQVPISAAPAGALVGRYFARAPSGVPEVSVNHGADTFPYGQCTYYVASRRDVTWAGNAWVWFSAANGIRPEGHVPVAGAIVVFHTGWFGHVAYIESVNPDGSYSVAEMNFWGNGGGWGRVDHRTIPANDGAVTGFIY